MPPETRPFLAGDPPAAIAVNLTQSGGRVHAEPPPGWRSEFQRDRDRIIHCSAFRRLEYKTQVFVNHEGDMFRTRLTHSLEVAQIARSVARALGVNEDLTEAIALAHDLGHTPFGHAGQSALNACMRDFGGFEHNLQSLRVVDLLEARYPRFAGLNLLFETREGILKHCSVPNARTLGAVGERFLRGTQPSLEAQIANVADEIAYNHHDMDDGVRSGLLPVQTLREHALYATLEQRIRREWPALDEQRLRHTVIREMLNHFVSDLIARTLENLQVSAVATLADVRAQAQPLLGFSAEVEAEHLALKRLLRRELYHHPKVSRMAEHSGTVLADLFGIYMNDARALPGAPRFDDLMTQARAVADYIAGMTDRFAIAEHVRHFGGHAPMAL